MASFDERKAEIAADYARAAASQNLKLFRQTMLDHQELVLEEEGDARDLIQPLRASGRRIMGRPVTATTVVELIDLVSDVREGMTGSQQLTLFMQGLLTAEELGGADKREWKRPAPPPRHRTSLHLPRRRSTLSRPEGDFPDLDLDGQGFGDGAVRGIAMALGGLAVLGGFLYLLTLL